MTIQIRSIFGNTEFVYDVDTDTVQVGVKVGGNIQTVWSESVQEEEFFKKIDLFRSMILDLKKRKDHGQ